MSRNIQYVSSKRAIAKVIRDFGSLDVAEADMIEWIGEVLSTINTTTIKEDKVLFAKVENYNVRLPGSLEEIIQILKIKDGVENLTPLQVSLGCETPEECKDCGPSDFNILFDCDGKPLGDIPKFTDNFTMFGDKIEQGALFPRLVEKNFEPVRLANNKFFSGFMCDENWDVPDNCAYEYQIFDGLIKTNFRSGQLAIAYRTTPLDEEGYPKIPDLPSVMNAISNYIIYRVSRRMFIQGRDGFERQMQQAEQDYQWYVKQSSSETFLPYGVDEHQNMAEANNRLFKTTRDYYNQFRNTGTNKNLR